MRDGLGTAFRKLAAAAKAAGMPEVEEGLWFDTPCLKVRGKSFARVKDPETLVLLCALDEKEILIEAEPEIFYETDHYKGWPAVLVRAGRIDKRTLAHRVEKAWRQKAPKRLIAAWEGERTGKRARSRRGLA